MLLINIIYRYEVAGVGSVLSKTVTDMPPHWAIKIVFDMIFIDR